MSASDITVINPLGAPMRGSTHVPGDKSISHRAVLFSAMAEGTSRVSGVLDSADVRSSIGAVRALGAQVNLEKQPDGSLAGGITGWGAAGPSQPEDPIDCGNSGTTVRLLMGILAPWPIRATLTGDASLQKRPMRRITAPLMKMGAHFEPAGQEHLPITVVGGGLHPITYDAPMASAQLKTAVLLAGMYADGTTTLNEPAPSRNHTELMLPEYGVATTAGERTASVTGPAQPQASEVLVPGDPSSAAFLVCAAVMCPGSTIQVENVSLNTARIGFTRTLERMGAEVSVSRTGAAGKEPYGIIEACYTPHLRGCEVPAEKIAGIIDEIPVLALVAAHAHGVTVFRQVNELRVKETDRLAAIIDGLAKLGVDAWCEGDDLYIEGQPDLAVPEGLQFDSLGDHRLAMTWSLVGLTGKVPVSIKNFEAVGVSYPGFLTDIERLAR
ncbi:3-phosphoshikimate 1-carboxyvinyltransferase [uncultured Senegalimassilia sp.]|uniref:3-phosphoshikimate 1-carboxyvinyltransferase n=1 Tax=uncultured Senegalimassilia sp. TaxID=1714350 RepID=UPI002673EAA1|nr:3-phosphoshikimate 1-carboxyvinyltransferase [uncultured Senegalimassilia sp.]